MTLIKDVGIDLARLVFSIHGIDEHDKCKLRKTIKRNNLLAEISTNCGGRFFEMSAKSDHFPLDKPWLTSTRIREDYFLFHKVSTHQINQLVRYNNRS